METREILFRVGSIIGSQTNYRIAEALGVPPQATSTWKSRNSIPWEHLYSFCKREKVSFRWLISGEDEDILPKGYAHVPHYRIAAESGTVKKKVLSTFVWKEDLLHEKFGKLSFATCDVQGQCMSPTIVEGDIIVMDMMSIKPEGIINGKIYVFVHGPVVVTGRLIWKGTELWASFDNPIFPDQQIERKHFEIIGIALQVVHDMK